jgi:hypothetical protein
MIIISRNATEKAPSAFKSLSVSYACTCKKKKNKTMLLHNFEKKNQSGTV